MEEYRSTCMDGNGVDCVEAFGSCGEAVDGAVSCFTKRRLRWDDVEIFYLSKRKLYGSTWNHRVDFGQLFSLRQPDPHSSASSGLFHVEQWG